MNATIDRIQEIKDRAQVRDTARAGFVLLKVSSAQALTEMVRAYLHSGNPSSLMNRIVQGARDYLAECPDGDAPFMRECLADLDALRVLVTQKEREHYSM
jgi:hypothetical protein